MAFATNSSAFGIKPNNTPATGSSLFGQPNTTGNSIFGTSQPQANTPTTTNSLFGGGNAFGQQNQQQQPAGSSIFGQAQQQPAAGGSIFGQSAQKPAVGSSIFGQSTQQQPAASTGASLFGQTSTQPSTGSSLFGQPAQQPAAGGAFGQANQQPAVGTGGSLFGQSTQQPATSSSIFGQSNQQPPTGTSMFGQPAQGTQSTGSTSLFGLTPQQQQQGASTFGGGTGNSLFGNNNMSSFNTGGFGGAGGSTLFAQKPGQQQSYYGAPTVQQPTGPPPFTKTTKFNDLSNEFKKTFEEIDSYIQGRIQIGKDLQQKKLGEEATTSQELIRAVQRDLNQTSSTIRNDLHVVRDLKLKADQAVHDTIISIRIVDGFKNPQNGAYLKDHSSFPLEFFTRVTNQIRERLVWYRATIEQIERKLSSMANQTHITPHGITTTLQAQHATFVSLASKTATLDAELQKIKTLYTQLWRARTGSVRDPFDTVGVNESGAKPDLGLSGLSVQ
ncbi:hypothetical protein F5050DRAFT_1516228 [Lentinula boryana]|uniref:Nucleoporin nup45 n=1 Tax=Lentinula boryana TaxID=40481 RepID=A0ABQ8QE85_9AGAR|nr:hypothetical protein F5050DRAFT_1516228 [Lentinula boryana]